MTEGRGLSTSQGGFVRRKRGDGRAACSRGCSEPADGECLLKSAREGGGGVRDAVPHGFRAQNPHEGFA